MEVSVCILHVFGVQLCTYSLNFELSNRDCVVNTSFPEVYYLTWKWRQSEPNETAKRETSHNVIKIHVLSSGEQGLNYNQLRLSLLIKVLSGDKQVTLIGGQTGCPYWGTNRLPLLGDKQDALIGGQLEQIAHIGGQTTEVALIGGQTGCPNWGRNRLPLLGDNYCPYWGTNR